jgi:hypothetical protein
MRRVLKNILKTNFMSIPERVLERNLANIVESGLEKGTGER